MFRSKARTASDSAAEVAVFALAAALTACSFVSLERLGIVTAPSKSGEIAPAEGPLRVGFSIEPVHDSAERAFRLSSLEGSSTGNFEWRGSGFDFRPVPPLKKGYLWTMSISGAIRTADGRTFDAAKSVMFYAGSSAALITLDSFSPAKGATVSISEPISLRFSRAVDASLFTRNFSLSPATDYDLSWSADGLTARIGPKMRWTAQSAYTWLVKADLADVGGVGLAKTYDGAFIVQAEGHAPGVVSVHPAIFAGGYFLPLSTGLDTLAYEDAIFVTFDQPVTRESVSDSIKLTPSVKGRVLQDGPSTFAFVPEEGYAARTEYRLSILSTVATPAGTPMSEDYAAWFRPKVADIGLARAFVNGGAAIETFCGGVSTSFTPDPIDEGAIIALEFNPPITDASQRDRTVTLVSCTSLFPSSLSPSLRSAQWVGGSRLELSYTGFTPSTTSTTFFYKVLVPGGISGISDGAGGTMEMDRWFVIVTL